MLIRLGYEIAIDCPQPVALISKLDVHDERQPQLLRQSEVETTPFTEGQTYRDRFGNHCRRYLAPAGEFRLQFDGLIEDSGERDPINVLAQEVPVQDLPDEALDYLLGSRYCETDHLSNLAWQLFGNTPNGWPRVQAICDYVHNRLSFGYGYARSTRTAAQGHEEQVGVCRDFAHLAITFTRCMNIPARYVNGYLGDIGVPRSDSPMDFSAWFEAYLGGRWYTFDARHNVPRIGRVVIARGRDATDVPMLHSFGPHNLTYFKVVTEEVEEATSPLSDRAIDRTMTAQMLA